MGLLCLAIALVLSEGARPCEAEASQTAKWAAALAAHVAKPSIMLPPEIKLVEAPNLEALSPDVVFTIVVSEENLLVDDQPFPPSRERLRDELRRKIGQYLELHRAAGSIRAPPKRVNIVADASASWGRIALVAAAAIDAALTDVTFVFAGPATADLVAPPTAAAADVLKPSSGDLSPLQTAERVSRSLFAACAGAQAAFPEETGGFSQAMLERRSGAADQPVTQALKRLSVALAECPCTTDFTSVRTLLWQSFFISPPLRGLRLKLNGYGASVTASAREPWSEASKKLQAMKPGSAIRMLAGP